MDIKENYVSLETAKWLKANGFNEPCHKVWDTSCAWTEWYVHSGQHVLLSDKISCPTLGHVVEWFIKKHGLFIKVDYDYYTCEGSVVDKTFKYGVDVIELGKKDEDNNVVSHISAALFDDHYEAVEHGIDMCIVIVAERDEQRKANIQIDIIPEETYVPYDIISELIRKGLPVKNVTEWYCYYDNDNNYVMPDEPITKEHYPLVSQDRVLNWLKMKHDIFVEISIFSDEEMETLDVKDRYAWNIYFDSTGDIRPFNGTGPDKPTAINNAIKCCVKDLI